MNGLEKLSQDQLAETFELVQLLAREVEASLAKVQELYAALESNPVKVKLEAYRLQVEQLQEENARLRRRK